jgi:hypothetical protein
MERTVQELAEECSRKDGKLKLNMKFLPELLAYFKGFLDNERLHAELAAYEQWAARNSAPLLQNTFLHRPPDTNMLVAAIWSCKPAFPIWLKSCCVIR